MTDELPAITRVHRGILAAILLSFAGFSAIGTTWGLPGEHLDEYLFGENGEPWPGEKIYRLAGAGGKFSATRGADVDIDPLDKSGTEALPLTASDEDVAKIYMRYRLYTYQPDEMITMMALAGMRPGRLEFDPRLYQYGGLFIYPVGALIGICGLTGLIDVHGDVVYYLDNPDEFGKFYVVARGYAAAWGLVGVCVVFAIGRRLGGTNAGLLAAVLFALMPVVICMAHEGKPHLPGAVLMLLAVLFAMRHAQSPDGNGVKNAPPDRRDWWLMCGCCGAALGMVLSSLPILALIPLMGFLDRKRGPSDGRQDPMAIDVQRVVGGIALAAGVYLITNPYIAINAVVNREVLSSNFGNSLAMYEIARIGEGLIRVLELTGEGVTWPVLVLGTLAAVGAMLRRNTAAIPLAVTALIFFLQFVLIGAGKPAEYGRFGVFANTALAIGSSCLLTTQGARWRIIAIWVGAALVITWTAYCGGLYLWNFHLDTTGQGSRVKLASVIAQAPWDRPSGGYRVKFSTTAEPAPYCFPPVDFARADIVLLAKQPMSNEPQGGARFFLQPVDQMDGRSVGFYDHRSAVTPISWANKPFEVRLPPSQKDRD